MSKLLGIIIALLSVVFAAAQENKPLADAGTTTCGSPQSGGVGKWVTSKAGFSAAVELRVRVTGIGKQRRCVTSWLLHVRDGSGKPRRIAVAEREDVPEDNEWAQENSFEINAWSNDRRVLLMSEVQVLGDGDETTPIIYDFVHQTRWRIELQPLFEEFIPADCYVVYRALRFADDGKVLIEAMSTDDDREEGTKACFPDSRWRLDFRNRRISRSGPKKSE